MSIFKKISQAIGLDSVKNYSADTKITRLLQQDIDDRLVRRIKLQNQQRNSTIRIGKFTNENVDKVFTNSAFERPILTAQQIIYKNKIKPTEGGLYPHEILVLEYAKIGRAKYLKIGGETAPRFWWYKYGIKDFQKLLEDLSNHGFLEIKDDVYKITEKGEKSIKNQEYVLFIHKNSKNIKMTIWDWQNWLDRQPEIIQKMSFRDQWWGYLNQTALMSDPSSRSIANFQMIDFLNMEAKEKKTARAILRALNFSEIKYTELLKEAYAEYRKNDRLMEDSHFSDDLRKDDQIIFKKNIEQAIENAIKQSKKLSVDQKKTSDFKDLIEKISTLKNSLKS